MQYVSKIFGYGTPTPPTPEEEKRKTSQNPLEASYDSLQVEDVDTAGTASPAPVVAAEDDKKMEENKKSLWHLIKGLIGVDVTTTVSLPIWLFEDLTYLQRLAEMAEFSLFLDEASKSTNQFERLMYISIFCISGFHGTERFDKPFNPVIGETFEFLRKDLGVTFIAEQVSHKPPVSACHLQNENFHCWQNGILNVRFLGNSLDLDSTGSKGYVNLPKLGEVYQWTPPRSTVHNCLVGRVWVDHWGSMPIVNYKTGDKIEIKWKRCGWFGANRYEVEGDIVDSNGTVQMQVFGKWNKSLYARWLFDGGLHPKGTVICMWNKDPTQVGPHHKTPYAMTLNEMDEKYENLLPCSDSRLRPDRRHLEKQDSNRAATYKLQVEDRQRQQENARKAKNEPWVPRWFSLLPDEFNENQTTWVYTGNYWEERAEKEKLLEQDPASTEAQKLAVRPNVVGTACDFKNYAKIE